MEEKKPLGMTPLPDTQDKGKYHIPPEKREMVYHYIGFLRRKYPNMKLERIARKAVEYFKLKKLDA